MVNQGCCELNFGTHEIGFEFENNPPHHLRDAEFAQISLVLSVEQWKNDFKLWAAFDFT
jgi:hypothetical protein